MSQKAAHKHIRSYVLRGGRLTRGQELAIKTYWDKYGIESSIANLDLNEVFNRNAPKILDIGSGTGETTLTLAKTHPENDYIAVEVHRPGIGMLMRKAAAETVNNIRIINHDVVEILRRQVNDQSLDEVYIFFPDPWPKKRHHKRRLISSSFLKLLVPKLKSHARLYIATDWPDLAEHILTTCDNNHKLLNLAGTGNTSPRPYWRPLTRFEERGLLLGQPVYDFVYAVLP